MIPARSDNEVMDTKLLYEAYTDASNRPRVPLGEPDTTAGRKRPRPHAIAEAKRDKKTI